MPGKSHQTLELQEMKKLLLILFTFIVGCSSPPDTNLTAVQRFFDLDENLQNVEMLSYLDGAKLCHQAIEWHAINGQMMLGIAKECRHVKDPLCG